MSRRTSQKLIMKRLLICLVLVLDRGMYKVSHENSQILEAHQDTQLFVAGKLIDKHQGVRS